MKKRFAVLAALFALLLSGCGVRVGTELTIDENISGTRTMTLTVSQSDVDDALGGDISKANHVITDNVPSSLSYSGLTKNGDSYTGTMTLTYESLEDYTTKVTELLETSGFDGTPELTLSYVNEGLVEGVQVIENFSSEDLLGWMPAVLEENGIFDEDSASSFFDTSDTMVVVAGEETYDDAGWGKFSLDETTGTTIYSPNIEVFDQGEGSFDFFATAWVDGSSADLKSYIEEALGGDVTVTDRSGAVTIESAGRTADEVQEFVRVLLGNDAASFALNTEGAVAHVTGDFSCGITCSEWEEGILFFYPRDGWTVDGEYPDGASKDGRPYYKAYGSDIDLTLSFAPAIQDIEMRLKLGESPSLDIELAYLSSDVDVVGTEAVAESLTVDGLAGEVTNEIDDEETVFTLVFSGSSPEEFQKNLTAAMPSSYYEYSENGTFKAEFNAGAFIALEDIVSNLAGSVSLTVEPPALMHFEDIYSTLDDGNIVFNSQKGDVYVPPMGGVYGEGLTVVGLVTLIVLLVLVVAAVAVAFIFRKKITQALAKRRAEREARVAQSAVNTQTVDSPQYGATQPRPEAGESMRQHDTLPMSNGGGPINNGAEWTESDLF